MNILYLRFSCALRSKPVSAMALSALLAGCAVGENPFDDAGNGNGDTGVDIGMDSRFDVPTDTQRDVVTDRTDVQMDTGPRCTSNAQCTTGNARICDTTLGRCVECIPSMDMCRSGTICDPNTRLCVAGCDNDGDCRSSDAGTMSDASSGANAGFCLVSARRCVECLAPTDCAPGTICMNNSCVPGCSAQQPCPMGMDCCNGACTDTQTNPQSCGRCGNACSGANPNCCGGSCTNQGTDPQNCGACGRRCNIQHATARCQTGMCSIGMCDPGWSDADGMTVNGCECNLGMASTVCSTATSIPLIAPATSTTQRGSLTSTTASHYYRVRFATMGNPVINFQTNPGSAYRFDVVSSCTAGSGLSCQNRPSGADGLTDWSFADMSTAGPTRDVAWPDDVLVRVYVTSDQTMCNTYEIVLAN